jgi:hypothetical protein
MSDIETRLSDALTARADLVQAEQVSPAAPVADFRAPWWRRTGPLLAVAAVAVLVIAAPFVAQQVSDGEKKSGDGDHSAATDPHPTTPDYWFFQHPDGLPQRWNDVVGVEAGAWVPGDFDGDGRTDRARLSGSEGNTSLQVEMGEKSLTTPVEGGPNTTLAWPTTIEGSDTAVFPVVVGEGAAGTSYQTWHVYLIRGGRLVEASAPDVPFFGSQVSNLTEDEGGRDTWRTWAQPRNDLFTMRYDDRGTPITDPGYPGPGDIVYRNTFYRWVLDGTQLTAIEIGEGCTVRSVGGVTGCP